MRREQSKQSLTLDQFLSELRHSIYFNQQVVMKLYIMHLPDVKFKYENKETVVAPATFTFTLSEQVKNTLVKDVLKIKKNKQVILCSQSQHQSNRLIYLNSISQQQQFSHPYLCVTLLVGLHIAKQTHKRVDSQLRNCLQRKLSQSTTSQHTPYRMFIFIGKQQITQCLYYPNVSFLLRKIHLTPNKIIQNEILQEVLKFNYQCKSGYLSFSKSLRLVLMQRTERESTVVGVWVAGQDPPIWAALMEYLTNPHLSNRTSVNVEHTGILLHLQPPKKITYYLFEVPARAKWAFTTERYEKLHTTLTFSPDAVIHEEEKEESEVGDVPSIEGSEEERKCKQKYFGGEESVKMDERDVEIRLLRKQLEFYKNWCEQLQKIVTGNQMTNVQYMQAVSNKQMQYQQKKNDRDAYNAVKDIYVNQSFQKNNSFENKLEIGNLRNRQQQKQVKKDQEQLVNQKRNAQYEQKMINISSPKSRNEIMINKQNKEDKIENFKGKDLRNMSFAQENVFVSNDEEISSPTFQRYPFQLGQRLTKKFNEDQQFQEKTAQLLSKYENKEEKPSLIFNKCVIQQNTKEVIQIKNDNKDKQQIEQQKNKITLQLNKQKPCIKQDTKQIVQSKQSMVLIKEQKPIYIEKKQIIKNVDSDSDDQQLKNILRTRSKNVKPK